MTAAIRTSLGAVEKGMRVSVVFASCFWGEPGSIESVGKTNERLEQALDHVATVAAITGAIVSQ